MAAQRLHGGPDIISELTLHAIQKDSHYSIVLHRVEKHGHRGSIEWRMSLVCYYGLPLLRFVEPALCSRKRGLA
jgi:hypothetical protein